MVWGSGAAGLARCTRAALTRRLADGAGKGCRRSARSTPRSALRPGPVRRRASYYARNNPWIGNGVAAIVSGAVGCGIKPQSQHPDPAVRAALHAAWERWTYTADADGVTDGYGLQALAVRAMVESGECFAHLLLTSE